MSDITRKLASVQVIEEVHPIEGADNIEYVVINGWEVVAKKGEFKPLDLCVYFEIDSFLPAEDERFAFLEPKFITWNGKRGMRLKTIRLRGQISQGLALPISAFPEAEQLLEDCKVGALSGNSMQTMTPEERDEMANPVGKDLTELLKIEKWEAPIPAQLAGKVRGTRPSFVPKTDQHRVQNIWGHLQPDRKYGDHRVYEVTQKLDGSSMTVYLVKEDEWRFGVCSRNQDLIETEDNTFWKVARKLDLERHLHNLRENYGGDKGWALQGELMGPGIQGNSEQLIAPDFYVFDIFSIDKSRYLPPALRRYVLAEYMELSVNHVPVLDPTLSLDEFENRGSLLAFADGPSLLNPKNTKREGLVFKSVLGDLSFKVISNKFLLSEK